MARTRLRPPLLNSATLNENLILSERPEVKVRDEVIARRRVSPEIGPEVQAAMRTLDQLAATWDALDAVRSTSDPTLTPEAAALRYRAAWERATATTTASVRQTADRLAERRAKLVRQAREQAGLAASYPELAEMRAALRSLSQEDRDAAISSAAKTGDVIVLAAAQAHRLLVGPTTVPVQTFLDQFVAERAPAEIAQIGDIDDTMEHLQLAYDAFAKSALDMRDPLREQEGKDGAQKAREAEARLEAALKEPAAA